MTASVLESSWNMIHCILRKALSDLKEIRNSGPGTLDVIIARQTTTLNDICTYFSKLKTPWTIKNFLFSQIQGERAKELVLGTRVVSSGVGTDGKTVQRTKFDTLYYFSIEALLKTMTSCDGFWKQYSKHLESVNNVAVGTYTDYRNGMLVRRQGTNADNILNILLYFDEIELCNPLGSRAGNHKLGMVYLLVKDLPAIFSSKLEHIHPITIVKSSDVKRYGVSACFSHIVAELSSLWESGMRIRLVDTNCLREIKIRMSQLTGDNLGIHQVLGLNESFSSNYPCRFCKAHRTLCHKQIRSDPSPARTASDFTGPGAFTNPSETGVKERSIFYDLPYFCVSNNKAVDLMHDILEGVAKYDLNIVIPKLISKGFFDLNYLNSTIAAFNYGRIYSKTHPPPFKSLTLPNLSASQVFCLLHCITFMVGDKVPDNDDCWELLLCLRDIIDFTFSASMSEAGIEHLRCRIEDHHALYMQISGDTLKPKFHHLLHYPDIIREIGPLKQFWVMRFEAKHRFAKRIANNICNFRNICKSVAERYQLSMIDSFKGSYYSDSIDTSDSEVVNVTHVPFAKEIINALRLEDCSIEIFRKLVLQGSNLYLNDMMLYKYGDNELCFGMIKQIFGHENEVYILYQVYSIKYFSYHFHAYSLKESHEYVIEKALDIAYHHPLHVFSNIEDMFVTCPELYI